MLNYANYRLIKEAVTNYKNMIAEHEETLAQLKQIPVWSDAEFAISEKNIKELNSMKLNLRALETELKKFNLKPATAA